MQERRVIPFKHYPLDDEDATWSGPKEIAAAEVDDLKRMSTYVDTDQDDTKAGYKLPHHRADGYNTVWRGVAAAMAALLGARGGVDIPENERKGVFRHLERHYEEFGKDVPEFKEYSKDELKEIDNYIEDFDIDKQCKCLECDKELDAEMGEKFVHDGKCPLCEDCHDKAKGEGIGSGGVLNTDDGIQLEEGKKTDTLFARLVCSGCNKVLDMKDGLWWFNEFDRAVESEVEVPDFLYKAFFSERDKAGAVLRRANKNKLKQSIELIGAVLASSEPAEEDGKDTTDTKPQPPKDVKLNDVADKLDMLINAIVSIGKDNPVSDPTEESDIEETKAPEINLEEMELPPTPKKGKDEVDMEMLSKAVKEIKQSQLEKISAVIKAEIRKATGVID
jgi:hypothetical protein